MSTFNVTDQEILTEIQYALLETPNGGASITSGYWSIDEIIQYINDRQQRLLEELGLIVKEGVVGGAIGQHRYVLPTDSIRLRRVTWNAISGTRKELIREDEWSLDNLKITWAKGRNTPQVYTEGNIPPGMFEVYPAPIDAGYFTILYVPNSSELSNSGVRVSVPDEFAPYIKWGALADCLKKAGPQQDLIRAAYCEERYQEGIDLGDVLMQLTGESDE